MPSARVLLTATSLLVAACGGESSLPVVLELPIAPIPLEPGEQTTSLCHSISLDNDEAIFVDSVRLTTSAGWHHSNWFVATEGFFDGPDGTWPCAERQFDEVAATLSGGVLFAQSTQAVDEDQTLPPGAAIAIPPHSRVIGQIHLINTTPEPMAADGTMVLHRVERETVTTRVSAMVMAFYPLALPASRRSEFRTTCDLTTALGQAPDFNFYWILPHYHELGERMRLGAAGGTLDGTTIFESNIDVGEPGGVMLDPRFGMAGADGLEFACRYNNTTDQPVGFGLSAADEMCLMLAFTDSPKHIASGVLWTDVATSIGVDREGTEGFEGPCKVVLIDNAGLYL